MTTNSEDNDVITSNVKKTPKIRSVAYPSYSISSCIELTSLIDAEFTDIVYSLREDISKNLGLSGGALLMRLSSCVQYGLLELKSKEGYKPTPLYKKISKPLPSENVNDFLKECLLNPELYKKLINEFSNRQLPSTNGLANILDRNYAVKGNASTLAAKIFLNNLFALDLVDVDNTLNMDGQLIHTKDVVQEVVPEVYDDTQKKVLLLTDSESAKINEKTTTVRQVLSTEIEIPIFLRGGRGARLIVPADFSDEDMQRVAKVVNGYLP